MSSSIRRGRSLADVVSNIDGDEPLAAEPLSVTALPAPSPAAPQQTIVPVNVLVTPADRKRLRQLSLDTGLSVQRLGHEAWNLLLASRGLPPLEPVAANVPSGRLKRREP
jgi:hypothetical protein